MISIVACYHGAKLCAHAARNITNMLNFIFLQKQPVKNLFVGSSSAVVFNLGSRHP